MPSTTPHGFPYPVGTDRVADGDDAIRALAEAVDTKVGVLASGVATIANLASGAIGAIAVTFPVGRFSVAPVVTCSGNGGSTAAFASTSYTVSSLATTGCLITGYRATGSTGNQQVGWIAHQV